MKLSLHVSRVQSKEAKPQRGVLGRQWSTKLLQDYYGAADDNNYISTRLEGRRIDGTDVHIYEMFWADLARPTNSILSFLLALFQFILGLPGLSRLAIVRPDADPAWKCFQSLHRYASRVFQIVLPLGAVILLVALACAIPAIVTIGHLKLVSAAIDGGIVAVLGFLLMNHFRRPIVATRTGWIFYSFLPAILVFAAAIACFRFSADNSLFSLTLTAEIWLFGAGLFWWALNAYQVLRPGMQGWGLIFYGATTATFLCFLAYAKGTGLEVDLSIQQASFWTVQWILFWLRLSWITLALLAIAASVVGAFAWRRASLLAKRAKAKAAVRTSRLALALPSFLFILVTSILWMALFRLGQKVSTPFYCETVLNDACPRWLVSVNKTFAVFPTVVSVNNSDYLKGVLGWSVGSGSALVILMTFAALGILTWWALPSVLTETRPSRRRFDWYLDHHTEPPRNSKNHESMWMGSWISRGLDLTALVTWLLWTAIFVVPAVFMYSGKLPPCILKYRTLFANSTDMLIAFLIPMALVVAVRLRSLSSVLRVIRDVTTYLSSGPIEATPRAKIFERYVSLLRYVAQYKGEDGCGYDHVVIVAHSLGALISGDLLNLLEHQMNDPRLGMLGFGPSQPKNKIPIRLFTMGNPLRQLLNRFFPYLYDWIREAPDNGSNPLPVPRIDAPTELDSDLPDPADLGVEKWVSAYRSGDYVGRSLWLDEWYKRTATCSENGIYPEPIHKVTDGARVEFCIGAGAHTHYWDDTAPDIAEALNDLI